MDDLTLYVIYTIIIALLLAERAYSAYGKALSTAKHKKLLDRLICRDIALDEAIVMSGSSSTTEALQLLNLTKLHVMQGECVTTDDVVLVNPRVYFSKGRYFLATSSGYLYRARDIMVTGTTGLKMNIPA